MDYKEKYEMALEGIQEILGSGEDSIKMSRLQLRLQGIFPELKESEDEKIRKDMIETLKKEAHDFPSSVIAEKSNTWIAWLEKQGEQGEIDYDEELKRCKANPLYFFDKYVKVKLKEQKSAWSEEDEDNLNSAIYYIRREPYRECDVEPIVDWLRNKLSSLKPQSTWKPSDEQMDALESAIVDSISSIQKHSLESLYNKLKKL